MYGDLFNQIQQKSIELTSAIKGLSDAGNKRAQTEYKYKTRLTQECYKLRDNGMAVTLIDKTVYGIPEVAMLRAERDISETMYQVYMEKINAIKLEIRMLDSQLSREWGNVK